MAETQKGGIYLDNAATTRPSEAVCNAVMETMGALYGNPSSLHAKGLEAERAIGEARVKVSRALGVAPESLYFTSGGTEANNMALFGICGRGPRGGADRIVSTAAEHPSILKPLKELEGRGWDVSYLPLGADGNVDPNVLEAALDGRTALIALSHVNNETGAALPVEDVARLRDRICPKAPVMLDCVQSFAKLPIPVKGCADIISVSAHKIHGPRGAGALYVSDRVRLAPVIYGGGQERGLRSGTENTPAIAGFGVAAQEAADSIKIGYRHVMDLKTALLRKMEKTGIEYTVIPQSGMSGGNAKDIGGAQSGAGDGNTRDIGGAQSGAGNGNAWDIGGAQSGMNGGIAEDICGSHSGISYGCSPYILMISFPGMQAELILNHLSRDGVYVSTGAACSSRRSAKTGSHVLAAMGLKRDIITGAVRFSFSRYNTINEVETAADRLSDIYHELRRKG